MFDRTEQFNVIRRSDFEKKLQKFLDEQDKPKVVVAACGFSHGLTVYWHSALDSFERTTGVIVSEARLNGDDPFKKFSDGDFTIAIVGRNDYFQFTFYRRLATNELLTG